MRSINLKKTKKSLIVKLAFAATIGILSTGCSWFTPSSAKDSGFLPDADKLKPMNERAPWNGVYYPDREKFYRMKDHYKHIYIAPVDTTFLEAKINAKHHSAKSKREDIEDLRELAKYLEERMKRALREYPNVSFDVIDKPEADTISVEMAISELKPTHQVVNTISAIAGFIVPPAAVLQFVVHGSIAIEALVRDANTNEIVVEFKDRQIDKAAVFTVKDYQEYAHARETIDDWSKTFAELAATPYEHRVSGPWPVTLIPF